MSKLIKVNKKNKHLVEVVINRPEKLNAMTKPMWIELGKIFKKLSKNKERINEINFEKYLQTKNIPDPDLLIRTGNTKRLSNFLLWQLAYSEIFFEKKLWPDFKIKDYNRILKSFKKIKRNFGSI